jgi:NADH/NAD ratio-sensing transcriptional regulator Rex
MSADNTEESAGETTVAPSANLALTLVVFSWCAWMVFQTVQLVRERVHLTGLKSGQEIALQEASKIKTQIESITADTAKLAAGGNPVAQRIVAEFRKRGIKVSTDTKPAAAAK